MNSIRKDLFLFCVTALLAAGAVARAGENPPAEEQPPPREMTNLMPNSGFEEANEHGLPRGWWQHPAKMDPQMCSIAVDDSVRHSGDCSVKAEVKSKQNIALIYSALKPFNQGDTLSLSIFYKSDRRRPAQKRKSDDYSSSDALASFAYHFRGAYVSTKLHGKDVSDGWEKLETTCVVPPHHARDDYNELTLKLLMYYGLGTVWWDDLVVKKLNRYSLNLAPYAETVPLGKNRIVFSMENYTGAKEKLRCEVSLGGKVIARRSFTSTGAPKEQLSLEYSADAVGEHALKVSLVADKDENPLFSAEKRIDVADRLETSVVVPTYVWPEKDVAEVVETIKVYLPAAELAQCRLRVCVRKAEKTIKEESMPAGGEEITYRLPVRGITAGDYVIAVTLLDNAGRALASREETFHVMDRPKSVLTIKDGVIQRDGEPFFPIGMYGMGTYDGTYREFADAGFNFVHTYAFSGHFGNEATLASERGGIELMDGMARDGMLVLMETPRFKLSKGDIKGLRRWYQVFSNHPSCLFYYEEESFIHGHASYEDGKKWMSLLREIHPEGLICLADWVRITDEGNDPRAPAQKRAYGEKLRFPEELCDIGVDYWYPFPPPEETTEIASPGWLKYHMDTDQPIMVVLQSNKRHWITHPPERAQRQRWPLPEEYRVQAYLAVIYGARGLFYFGHHFKGKEKEAHWDYLKSLVSEIRDMAPVILSATSDVSATITGTDKVDCVLKEHGGTVYLIAAYRDAPAADATFSLPFEPASVKVRYEDREIACDGDSFQDTFEAYAVHIYEIRR